MSAAVFDMQVFIINDETGQTGKANVCFFSPTPEKAEERLKKFEVEELVGAAPGFRLMTRLENREQGTIEKAGKVLALPSRREWDSIK